MGRLRLHQCGQEEQGPHPINAPHQLLNLILTAAPQSGDDRVLVDSTNLSQFCIGT